jgi:hypothetical protein
MGLKDHQTKRLISSDPCLEEDDDMMMSHFMAVEQEVIGWAGSAPEDSEKVGDKIV